MNTPSEKNSTPQWVKQSLAWDVGTFPRRKRLKAKRPVLLQSLHLRTKSDSRCSCTRLRCGLVRNVNEFTFTINSIPFPIGKVFVAAEGVFDPEEVCEFLQTVFREQKFLIVL